jgi:hypothetical protein
VNRGSDSPGCAASVQASSNSFKRLFSIASIGLFTPPASHSSILRATTVWGHARTIHLNREMGCRPRRTVIFAKGFQRGYPGTPSHLAFGRHLRRKNRTTIRFRFSLHYPNHRVLTISSEPYLPQPRPEHPGTGFLDRPFLVFRTAVADLDGDDLVVDVYVDRAPFRSRYVPKAGDIILQTER